MEREERRVQEYYTIDVAHILSYIWKHAWAVVLSGVLAALIGLLTALFIMDPIYSADVRLYVNINASAQDDPNFTITPSDLTAAKSLVKTCGTILTGRSTLERVIEQAELDCSWKDLAKMITYESSNDTEIMRIVVTCDDPYVASRIANTIAEVLPQRIEEIVAGTSMELVDAAEPDLDKVGPSGLKYTVLGGMLGGVLIVLVLIVLAMMDDTIHDDEYVVRTYDYPILGKVPDLMSTGGRSYGYYSRSHEADRGKGA
ncbi:MAG: hypothetical protein IJY28_03495 [Clostridia bacterium]|nr:hypothetical protein [Clostridia bacterium]